MQAVILAAGKGSRLRPLTDNIPKPMVPVNGRPILEYVLRALPNGVSEILMVTGHQGETIKTYFGNEFRKKKITYIEDVLPKGTGYALKQTEPHIYGDFFLVINGADLQHPLDLLACMEEKRPTILAMEVANPERYGICKIDDRGFLQSIVEKPKEWVGDLASIGTFFLPREIFRVPAVLHENGEFYLSEQVGELNKTHPLYVEKARYWRGIDTHEDLQKAEEEVRKFFPQ